MLTPPTARPVSSATGRASAGPSRRRFRVMACQELWSTRARHGNNGTRGVPQRRNSNRLIKTGHRSHTTPSWASTARGLAARRCLRRRVDHAAQRAASGVYVRRIPASASTTATGGRRRDERNVRAGRSELEQADAKAAKDETGIRASPHRSAGTRWPNWPGCHEAEAR